MTNSGLFFSLTGHDVAVLAPDFYKAKIEKAKLEPIVYPLSKVSLQSIAFVHTFQHKANGVQT